MNHREAAPEPRPLAERLTDLPSIEAALARAVREALLLHKRAGNPFAVWRDGRVCWLSPDEIPGEPAARVEGESP